jgi:hypothetical protein
MQTKVDGVDLVESMPEAATLWSIHLPDKFPFEIFGIMTKTSTISPIEPYQTPITETATMSAPRITLRIFQSPPSLRSLIYTRSTSTSTTPVASHLPRVAQPSLWTSLIPKPLRRSPSSSQKPHWFRNFWANPVTPILCLAMLVGSQAIQTLTLRNEMYAYSRRTEAKIAVLKDVIGRVQRGEDVDVEGVLGTGDEVKEEEWFDGMFPPCSYV